MKIRYAAALAMSLTMVTVGCGGGDSASDGDRARTIQAPENEAPADLKSDGDKTLTEAQLKSALLTVPDLPTGYKAGTVEQDDSETDAGNDECAKKFDALDEGSDDEAAKAEASFEGGFGIVLEQSLKSYEDEDQAQFGDIIEVLSDCPSFTSTDADGTKTEFKLSALSFPKLGDDTLALALTGKTPDFAIVLNLVIVRLGRNVIFVSQGGLTADAAVLEQVTRKGLDKLATVAG